MGTDASAAEAAAFQAFLRGTSHVIILMNADGTVRWASPSVQTVLGYTPEEFCAVHPLTLIHPDDVDFLSDVMTRSAAVELDGRLDHGDARLAFDIRIRHRNGRWITLEVLGNNLLATPGINGRLVIARDISARRALDDALTALADSMGFEESLRRILSFLEIAVPGTAAAFWWPGHTPAWTAHDVPEPLLAEAGPWQALPADGSALVIDNLKEAMADGRLDPALAREAIDAGFSACWCIGVPRPERRDSWGAGQQRAPDGSSESGAFVFWSSAAGAPLMGHAVSIDRAASLALFAMTRHRLDRQRADQLERQTRQNEQLAEIIALRTDLILTMSHDLRTPLSAISGAADMLAEEGPAVTPDDQAAYLELIEHNTGRLLHMVDDLLLLAQLDFEGLKPARVPVDLADVATAAVHDVRPAARAKGVELELRATSGPDLLGDPQQLRHLVDNLVSNAVKYTPAGGHVEVEAVPNGKGWLLSVADDGIGIPAAEQAGIFGRFARGSNARSAHIAGSGLGLLIARAVAQSHGGDITVESEEGRGSRFEVRLRCAEEPTSVR